MHAAIADYKLGGYQDDQEAVRTVLVEFEALLKRFKAWRLCQQVPGMWPDSPPISIAAA